MSGPKKTSVFDYLNQRIENNKAKSGYENIVEPFNSDNVAHVDNEELQSNEGKDNISADVLDYLKVSSNERQAMQYAQSEAAKVAEEEDKKIFDKTTEDIQKIDDQINTLKKDKTNPEAQQQVEALKEQKKQLALSTQGNSQLEVINDKIKKLEEPYLTHTDNSWFGNGTSRKIADFISGGLDGISNALTNPEDKMKPEEKAQYLQLKKQRDTFYKPIASNKAQDWELIGMNLDMQLSDPSLKLTERWHIKNLKDQVLDRKRELEAYINGEDGSDAFFRKLGGVSYRTNANEGVKGFRPLSDAVDNMFDFIYKDDLYDKANKGYDKLTDQEKGILEVYAKIDEDKAFLSDKQKWSYGVVEGTMGSVGFVRDMYLTGEALKPLGAMVGLGEGTALAGSSRVLRATGSKLLARGVATGIKATDLAINYALQNQLNPQYINQELMKGSHIERDEEGNITNIYVKDKLFDYMGKVYEETAKFYTAEKKELENKSSLSSKEQERLTYLKIKLGEENSLAEHSLQEELATFKPASLLEAETKGFVNTSIENLTELYTGAALNGIGKLVGKGLTKVGAGKFVTKVASHIDDVKASFNSTKLGKLYKNWNNGVGKLNINGTAVIGSIPEEVAEEWAGSVLHSIADRDPKQFIDMFDTQANIDIAAQTLLMSAGFGLAGNTQTHAKVAYNKLINKRLSELKPQAEEAQIRVPQIDNLIQNYTNTLATLDKGTPEHTKLTNQIEELKSEKAEQEKVLQKFNTFKEDPSLTGLHIMKNIPGVEDSTFSATRNYIESRNDIRTRLNSLKLADTDNKVNEILNLSSLDGFGISDQRLRVDSLRSQGKIDEANLVEKSMFQNLVLQSFRSNTQDEFKKALTKLERDANLSPETIIQVGKAKEQLESLNKVYEFNKNKPNISNIMTLAMEKNSAKEGLEQIELDKNKIANDVRQEIDAFKQAHNINVDYSLDTLFTREFEDSNEQAKYDSFLKKLSEYHNTMIDNYLGLEDSKQALKNHLNNTSLALSEAIHPSLESVNKQKFLEQIQQDHQDVIEGKGNIISDKAEFNYNNEFTATPGFIEDLFNNRKKEWVGKTSEGKISEQEFERTKQAAINTLKRKQITEKIQKLQEVQDTIKADNLIKEEESPIAEPIEDIIVADTLAEEEFIDFTSNVEDDSALFFDFDHSQSPNIIIDDSEFDAMIENEKYTPEQIAFVKKAMYDIVSKIQGITGQEQVSFKEAISQYYKYFKNKETLKQNFRHFAKGWRENGYEVSNGEILSAFDSLFNVEQDVMSVEEGIKNLFENKIPSKPEVPYLELEDKVEQIQQEVAVASPTITTYDEENLPIEKSAIEEIKSQRTLNIMPKLGFNAISYEEVIENGVLTRKSTSSSLNIKDTDLIDFRDLLNPDKYYSGTSLNVEIADESLWSQINVSNGRNSDGSVKVIPFSDWVKERESKDSNFRNSQEFRDKQPIFFSDDKGKRLAYAQDVDWYNPYNVANPYGESNNPNMPTAEWQQYINEGKENTRALRNAIVQGLSKVTIERASNEGVFHKLLDEEPLITLSESNPQSFVTVQRGESLDGLPQEFATGESVLLNKTTDFDITKTNGHTWAIYRIGTMRNDKGDLVKTYRAFPINRQVTNEQVENVRWALAVYSAYSGNSLPAQYRMTKDQALDKYIKPIAKATGLNISDPKELMDYVKAYFQLTPNSVLSLRRPTDKQAYTADSIVLYLRLLLEDNSRLNDPNITSFLSQHTNSKLLKTNYKAVSLTKEGVTPITNEGKATNYQQYLKDTLLINIKAFNVGTDSNPVYATSIQPIINISYSNVVESEPTLNQRVNEVAQEVIQTITENKAVPLEEHIKFLNSIGIDLESFEDNDSLIENTDKLANLFNLVGNLNVVQEKTLRQFIVHAIGEKIDFDYKTKVSRAKISSEIKSEVNIQLRPIKATVKALLSEVESSTLDKAKALTDAYKSVLTSIEDIQNNFETIFDKAFEDIKKQTQLTEIEEDDVVNENEETLSEKDYTKDSIEESGKSKASYRLRRFLHKIPKYDSEGNPITGFLGLTEYMTFNDVYNELTKVLALGSEITSDYNAIISKLKESKIPFVKDILNKLNTADQQIKNEFVYNFVRHSLSSKFAMFENSKGVSLKIYDTNSNEIGRIIKSKWLNENKASNLYKADGSFNTDYAEALLAEFNSWDKDVTKVSTDQLKNWLEKLGMFMDNSTWKDIVTKGIFNSGKYYTFKELYSLNKGGLFLNIVNFLKEGVAKPENYVFSRGVNIFSDLGGVVNAIANIEANYNPQLIALSYRDSGKNISTQVPTKFVTDFVQDLKRSINGGSSLIKDLQSLSLSENSILLNLLTNEPTFKGMLEISHVGLTAIKEYGTKPTKSSITDLGELDYDLLTLTGFQDRKIEKLPPTTKIDGVSMRMANMLFPTMSDKTAGLFLKTGVFDFMKDADLLFTIEGEDVKLEPTVKELLFNHLVLPELKRIIKFHSEVKQTNIKNYDKAATIFHFLPILNTIKSDKGIRVIEELASLEDYTLEQIVDKYKDTFEDAIEKVINQEVEHKKQVWQNQTEEGVSKMFDTTYFTEVGKSPTTHYNIAIYDYVMNSMLFNAEVFKVFAGDISNYSQDKLFKGESNIYDITDDAKYISINKQIGVNLGKRLALLIAPGNKLANSYNEKYNQIMLQDSVDITENANYLIGLYYGKEAIELAKPMLEKYNKANSILNKYEQGEFYISPENLSRVNAMVSDLRNQLAKSFPEIGAYFDIESTDAQEYTTASEHVETLYRMGRLSDKDYQAILSKMTNTGTASYLTKRELRLVLQPIKPVYTGTQINKNWDVNRVIYIKSSSFPLLPQFTAGTKLDALRVKMEELESKTGRFTRASFQTANKVGATKNTVNPFDINSLEKIKEYSENDLDSTVLVLNRNNFRIQQDVPFKSDKKADDKVSMGTQFFKLLFGDGIIEENDYVLNGVTMTGKELYDHYNKAFETIVDTKKQELFLDLGLSKNGEVINQAAFVTKLQDLLVKEATSRGYSIKSLRGLKIEKLAAKAGFYYEFKTPLWLSSDSNRYESLLNSIVTNRLMKHKMPGNGFVAGSEAGLTLQENLKGIDQSKIIFLDNYNGKELQGVQTKDGVFTKAQVFVPSKFKNSDKELVDLFEKYTDAKGEGTYIKKNKEGKLTLKPGMIEKELLNSFSFRTPTSSHVSGSSVEIAGFLPSEMGDLMIVPKNFTKQKGLDYDIDKESNYSLNHFVMDSGKIEVLSLGHKEDALSKLQSIVDKFELENLTLDKKANLRKEILDFAIKNNFRFLDEDSVEELLMPEISVKEKLNRKALEFDRKLAENEFIKTHLAVFNNPNPKVQSKINRILSIDFAKEQAEKFEALNEEGRKNGKIAQYIAKDPTLSLFEAEQKYKEDSMNFSMLTYSYQKDKMSLGSIGKIAIGVYANYTTFNGLIQQSAAEIYIPSSLGNKHITIGKFTSDGILGREKTLDGERTIAEVFAEKENTATDNEKEQVLGRVGVNEATINVDAHLSLRGFDKDENGNAISYLLLSQPAVKQLNEKRKSMKGILGEFRKDEALINSILVNLSDGLVVYHNNNAVLASTLTNNIEQEPEIFYPNGSVLTGTNLLDGIKLNGQDNEIQLHALLTYLELEKEARGISKIQKTINTNTLGKSMIESQLKYEGLKEIANSPVLAGASKLLGDFIEITDESTKPDGYITIGDFYVKPTTPQGQIVINGLHYGNTLYKDFFPYQESGINNLVTEILSAQGKENINDTTLVENFETVLEEVKKYIYSRKDNNIFTGNAREARFELFKDTDTNTSLSTYIKDLLKGEIKDYGKGIKALRNNTLIKSFTFETGKGEHEVSLIKYNNASTDNLDEESLYNAIPELILLDAPLPDRNGKSYSTKLLAEDLVSYSYLEGGVQEATQFIKFIPVEYLETVGKYEEISVFRDGQVVKEKVFIPANRKLQSFNSKRNEDIDIFEKAFGFNENGPSTFTKQFFQHNPEKASKVTFKKVTGFDKIKNSFKLKEGAFTVPPTFLAMKNSKVEIEKSGEKLSLYEHLGNGNYQKINLLGQMGISEYDYRNNNAVSIKDSQVVVTNPVIVADNTPTSNFKVDSKTTIKGMLEQISKATLSPEYSHITEAAKALLPMMKEKGSLVLDKSLKNAGRAGKETLNITLNPDLTMAVSDNKLAMVFLHEFIHTISSNELDKYFDKDGVTLKTDTTIPSYVTDLFTVFSEFRKSVRPELDVLLNKINQSKDNSLGINYTDREKDLIYAGANIKEFLSVALTSPLFFEEMNKVEYKASGKTIFQKLSEVIMKMLNAIYPGLKENSVAQQAISQSLTFITEEYNNRNTSEIKEILNAESLANIDAEPIFMGRIDESNEIPSFDNINIEDNGPSDLGDLMIESSEDLLTLPDCI